MNSIAYIPLVITLHERNASQVSSIPALVWSGPERLGEQPESLETRNKTDLIVL